MTRISPLVAILMVALVLVLLHFRRRSTAVIFAAGSILGCGIPAMHHIGMAGMELCRAVCTLPGLVGTSVLAVGLCILTFEVAYGTFQAPHAIRTVVSLISGLEEHSIRVISPDIGGGFGNKVGAYAGYVGSVVASIVTAVPVKWVEDRMENLMSTAFARDYWMKGRISATKEGRITRLWCHSTADHGGFVACADPTKFPGGFMSVCTGSHDIPTGYLSVDGVYTNKAPGL